MCSPVTTEIIYCKVHNLGFLPIINTDSWCWQARWHGQPDRDLLTLNRWSNPELATHDHTRQITTKRSYRMFRVSRWYLHLSSRYISFWAFNQKNKLAQISVTVTPLPGKLAGLPRRRRQESTWHRPRRVRETWPATVTAPGQRRGNNFAD